MPEFVALRLYTGPLYKKYNAVLRAGVGESKMLRRISRTYAKATSTQRPSTC